MYDIPQRLKYIEDVKKQIKEKLDYTGQDTNVPFRTYADLIRKIPETSAMSETDIDEAVTKLISISGEKA